LLHDRDAEIVILACKICFARGSAEDRAGAIHRLIGLLANVDWMLRDEIENCLLTHFETVRGVIGECI
jgi:hypothetical protein